MANFADYKYHNMRALTVSPPKREGSLIFQFTRDIKILSRLKGIFLLYPEFDNTGRLHYHGFIQKKHLDLYLNDIDYLQRKMGFICIKDIKQYYKWFNYCNKEWKITKEFLGIKKPISHGSVSGYISVEKSDKNPFEKWVNSETNEGGGDTKR